LFFKDIQERRNIMDIIPWKSFGEISRLRREIDGIETSRKIRSQFDVPVIYI
jgi:hypothetical protein